MNFPVFIHVPEDELQQDTRTFGGERGGAEGEIETTSLEQVQKCWDEYLEFGGIFRLSSDLDVANLRFLIQKFSNLPKEQRPKKSELDLCTFPSRNDAIEEIISLFAELMELFPLLQNLEVENRLLETPWSSHTVSNFLRQGFLRRLDKLALFGVDLQGPQVGTTFEQLLSVGCQITELLLCSFALDASMLEGFCRGLQGNQTLITLSLYEVGLNAELLKVLVHQGLCTTNAPKLRSLNLNRNQLTSGALDDLALLLHCQSQLQFFSLSHNVQLFEQNHESRDEVEDREGVANDNHELNRHKIGPQLQEEEEQGGTFPQGLRRRTDRTLSPHEIFWNALQRHMNLLHFWAQSPCDPPPTIEDRAKPVLQRNAWLKRACSSNTAYGSAVGHALWPRLIHTCSAESTVIFAFLEFRMHDWMSLYAYRFALQQKLMRTHGLRRYQTLRRRQPKLKYA